MATQWSELAKKSQVDKLEQDIAEGNIVVAQATNASNAKNAEKINNVEIKNDENGVLRADNLIISKKYLLWEGEQSTSSTGGCYISFVGADLLNKNLEIHLHCGVVGYAQTYHILKFKRNTVYFSGDPYIKDGNIAFNYFDKFDINISSKDSSNFYWELFLMYKSHGRTAESRAVVTAIYEIRE